MSVATALTDLACTQAIAKLEALAIAGAGLYTELTERMVKDRSTHVLGQLRKQGVRRPKFLLPAGIHPTRDEFGRPHVVPRWQSHENNDVFLDALHFRMELVKVRFQIILVEFT